MLSKTLQDGLSDYGIGAKIRALRLKKKIGLVDLGKHTGLSPALLSKIERGRLFPTLPTLLRIALVFGVGLDYFFAGSRDKPLVAITRKQSRPWDSHTGHCLANSTQASASHSPILMLTVGYAHVVGNAAPQNAS